MLAIISSRSLFLRNKPVARLVGSAAVAAILSLTPNQASAAPQGGSVASGAAIISTGGTSTIVTQSTDRAVIDWQSFNLSQNESVEFKVPTNTSATLNRINDLRPSVISGSITSNGAVYFTNPNGLIFDANSSVTANGFFAATKHLNPSQFMAGGAAPTTLSGLGNRSVVLDGNITAPTVTAFGGTVTVNGIIEAARGNLLLSSTNLTTIGEGAVIRVDAEANGNGGRAIIWSDNHTDFHGYISAQGGTTSGDGGFVEVSGKNTLNYNGLVNTLATNGKTGTLLLDPTDITISSGTNSVTNSAGTMTGTGTAATSIVNIGRLETALGTSNVIIDANAGTGTGSGKITVAEAISAATAGSYSLTLRGGQITINAGITMRSNANLILNGTAINISSDITLAGTGTLTLNASIYSVWQNAGSVITARSVSGSAVDGFILNGANKITTLGAITNSAVGGIVVKNSQALAIASGITLNGGKGGVSILTPGYDLTLNGALTVRGSFLRLDAGANILKGGHTITATGLDVLVTSATTGNAASLTLGAGNFIYVTDNRSTITATTINNSTALPTAFDIAASGLTVTAASTNGQGLVYGGTVDIQGITSTSAAKDLRYIEGKAITVSTTASSFAGSLMLVANGTPGLATNNTGIKITANLTVGTAGDGISNLTMIHSGNMASVWGSYQSTGILIENSTVTAGGNQTLNAFGYQGNDAQEIYYGINIFLDRATLRAGNDLTLVQASTTDYGIKLSDSNLTAAGDLSLHSALNKNEGGLFLFKHFTSPGITTLAAGINGLVLLKTNNTRMQLGNLSNLNITQGRVRIDLGERGDFSGDRNSLNAIGLDVYYTSRTDGSAENTIRTLNVGDTGSFTFVTDLRRVTSPWTLNSGVTLTNTTTASSATIGWGSGLGNLTSGVQHPTHKIIFSGKNINNHGVVYGGAVTLSSLGAGSEAAKLTYIEGTGITTSGGNAFKGSILLVSSGTGTPVQNNNGNNNGFDIAGTLGAGADLSLWQIGRVNGAGISIGTSTLSAGASNFVTLKTSGRNLSLAAAARVSAGKVRIDLGTTGAMVSSDSRNHLTLTANGLDVYYTSAISGNSAKIDVGAGSFTFVNDRRSAGAVSLTSASTASDWGSGFGTLASGTATGGLTVITTGADSAINNQGVVYGGAVTINGVAAANGGVLTYIEGSSITVDTADSTF
ncbi:MAG: filamentous hemagglutinin N-terminal domain-containing protein, partial [Candidatus Pacebacteria bacterium]|nr:filamentous hemagglutinin N-terminal domain-containing protein [Candidatus Paceibacterota bacterium]